MTTPKRRFIEDLSDGENLDEVYLVGEKQLRANRQGNLYIQLQLRDRTGSIDARLWNAGENLFRSLHEGDFVQTRGKVQLFQGALQLVLNNLERIGCFLMDEAFLRNFSRAPAGIRNHHAFVGGLLEHVVNMLEAADRLLPLYPKLDRDLLLLGVFLHDIGKVRELSYDRVFGYTDEGQLVGHLVIGVEMLNEKAHQVSDLTGEPFPRDLLLRLQHMIVSHHGSYEFGSPKLPMTPEAIALHYLDNLDAKVHTFVRDIEEDRNSVTSWTPFSQSLQRRLFKGNQLPMTYDP